MFYAPAHDSQRELKSTFEWKGKFQVHVRPNTLKAWHTYTIKCISDFWGNINVQRESSRTKVHQQMFWNQSQFSTIVKTATKSLVYVGWSQYAFTFSVRTEWIRFPFDLLSAPILSSVGYQIQSIIKEQSLRVCLSSYSNTSNLREENFP